MLNVTMDKMKRQHTEFKTISANHVSDKGLISKTYREHTTQQQENPKQFN